MGKIEAIQEPVVVATEAWFNGIMDATRAAHGENGQHPLSLDKIAAIVWRGLTRQQSLIGAIGTPELVKGMIVLEVDESYYSEDRQLLERIAYVRPEYRRTTFARDLLRFAKRCSDETGIPLLMGIISDIRLEAKRRLYERELGLAGYWFKHDPKPSESVQAVNSG